MAPLPEVCRHFEGLYLEPSPRSGKACLEYGERGRHERESMVRPMYIFCPGRTILAFRGGVAYNGVMNTLLVFAGGGIGAVARYLLQGAVYRVTGTGFPYGTIVVNVLGCFTIGLLMSSMEERFMAAPSLRIFLTIGILGGFTTFSSFSLQTFDLLRTGYWGRALANIVVSVVLCFFAVAAGHLLAQRAVDLRAIAETKEEEFTG